MVLDKVLVLLLLVSASLGARTYRAESLHPEYRPEQPKEEEYAERSSRPEYLAYRPAYTSDYPSYKQEATAAYRPDQLLRKDERVRKSPRSDYVSADKPAYQPAYKDAYSYEKDYNDPPNYSFSYRVKDDYYNDFGHSESRNGDYTEGTYYVALPDGRVQTVTYTADGNGYVADVQYSGEATYDKPHKYESAYPKTPYAPYKAYEAK